VYPVAPRTTILRFSTAPPAFRRASSRRPSTDLESFNGTYYHHFPDKKAMFAELCTERELMAQAPSVLRTQYRHINDTVAQPPIERLLTALAERGALQPDVPVATVTRLLLAGLCEGNQIIAAAADRKAPCPGCSGRSPC
jgi:hypothetical protein